MTRRKKEKRRLHDRLSEDILFVLGMLGAVVILLLSLASLCIRSDGVLIVRLWLEMIGG